MSKSAIFISYRRDDCTGYAGRLEDALESAFGRGTVFRDVLDIAAGARFAEVIDAALSKARVVLVLIGPRWLGERSDGTRRIDEDDDFVRMEVALALTSACTVVPVLVAGTVLPAAPDLPPDLRPLTRRQAVSLNETSWDTDLARLIGALGLPSMRRRRVLLLGAAALVLAGGGFTLLRVKPRPPIDTAQATGDALLGSWRGEVRYGWGDVHEESFVFQRFAGAVTGTATFLRYPRGIEDLTIDGQHIRFLTRTVQRMKDEERELIHRYTAELDGDTLRVRLHSTGGFGSETPLEFTAHRPDIERSSTE